MKFASAEIGINQANNEREATAILTHSDFDFITRGLTNLLNNKWNLEDPAQLSEYDSLNALAKMIFKGWEATQPPERDPVPLIDKDIADKPYVEFKPNPPSEDTVTNPENETDFNPAPEPVTPPENPPQPPPEEIPPTTE